MFVLIRHIVTYFSSIIDVIGLLREWGPVGENEGGSKSANPQIRKIVVCDTRYLYHSNAYYVIMYIL